MREGDGGRGRGGREGGRGGRGGEREHEQASRCGMSLNACLMCPPECLHIKCLQEHVVCVPTLSAQCLLCVQGYELVHGITSMCTESRACRHKSRHVYIRTWVHSAQTSV